MASSTPSFHNRYRSMVQRTDLPSATEALRVEAPLNNPLTHRLRQILGLGSESILYPHLHRVNPPTKSEQKNLVSFDLKQTDRIEVSGIADDIHLNQAAISPDNKWIALIADGKVVVREMDRLQEIAGEIKPKEKDRLVAASFTPCGKKLLVLCDRPYVTPNFTLQKTYLQEFEFGFRDPLPEEPILREEILLSNPDDSVNLSALVANLTDSDFETDEKEQEKPPVLEFRFVKEKECEALFSPRVIATDGTSIYGGGNSFYWTNTDSYRKNVSESGYPRQETNNIIFSPESKYVALVGKGILILDKATEKTVTTVAPYGNYRAAAFHPTDPDLLAVGNFGTEGCIFIYRISTQQVLTHAFVNDQVTDLKWEEAGHLEFCSRVNGQIGEIPITCSDAGVEIGSPSVHTVPNQKLLGFWNVEKGTRFVTLGYLPKEEAGVVTIWKKVMEKTTDPLIFPDKTLR